jgi:hypothetical protein
MFGKVVSGLCCSRGGLVVVAGAIGLLASVGYLFAKRTPKPDRAARAQGRKHFAPVTPRIKVSQTRSEFGYVYWVVRETGSNPRYALFDTWQEALDDVNRRMNAAGYKRVATAPDVALTAV